jgi:hypothetical protein
MRAAIRAVVTFVLVLTLPMQGFAASLMLVADPGAGHARTDQSEPVASVAHASLDDSLELPQEPAHERAQGPKVRKSGWAKHEVGSSACCFAAIAPTQPDIDVAPANLVYACTDLTPRTSLSPEVLERPPRPFLA